MEFSPYSYYFFFVCLKLEFIELGIIQRKCGDSVEHSFSIIFAEFLFYGVLWRQLLNGSSGLPLFSVQIRSLIWSPKGFECFAFEGNSLGVW